MQRGSKNVFLLFVAFEAFKLFKANENRNNDWLCVCVTDGFKMAAEKTTTNCCI